MLKYLLLTLPILFLGNIAVANEQDNQSRRNLNLNLEKALSELDIRSVEQLIEEPSFDLSEIYFKPSRKHKRLMANYYGLLPRLISGYLHTIDKGEVEESEAVSVFLDIAEMLIKNGYKANDIALADEGSAHRTLLSNQKFVETHPLLEDELKDKILDLIANYTNI